MTWKNIWQILACCGLLYFSTFQAQGSTVLYSFESTTRAAPGSPSHVESFQLMLPDFLPVVQNGPVLSFFSDDAQVLSCVACIAPPVQALHFLRSDTSDLIQFLDADGTNRLFLFTPNALSAFGTFNTLPGINVNVGTVTVSAVPEPSTGALLLSALAAGAVIVRRRRYGVA